MKKMMLMLMMVMFAVASHAQLIVADDWNYVYVGVPGATTAIPRSSLPYGNVLTKGDILPLRIAEEAKKQAEWEFGKTGSIVMTAEAMTEPAMAAMGLFSQISAQVKAAKAAKRARKEAEAAMRTYSQPATATRSTVAPATRSTVAPATRTATTPMNVNKNVTYNVSKQKFESADRQRCESAEDLISGF